jgi:hypothetical protein
MRPIRCAFCVLVLAAWAAMGQPAASAGSDFAERRAAYQTAFEQMRKADPVERDLKTAPPEELLKRIAAEQQHSEQFARAALDFYEALGAGLEPAMKNLPAKGTIPLASLRRTIEDGLKSIREEEGVVDGDLRTNKDPGVALALNDRREALGSFEANLLQQQSRLARASASGVREEAAVEQIRRSMQTLLAELADARERVQSIGAQRSQYYAELRIAVAARAATAGNPLAGAWEADGSLSTIPTRSIQLRIAASDGQLQGTLTIDCQPPASLEIPAHIEARFTDREGSQGPFAIRIGNGLPAALTLTPSDGRLRLMVTLQNDHPFMAMLNRSGEKPNPLLGTWRGDGKLSVVPTRSIEMRFAMAQGELQGTMTVECHPPAGSRMPPRFEVRFAAPPQSTGPFSVTIGGAPARITVTAHARQLVVVVDATGSGDFVGYLDRVE